MKIWMWQSIACGLLLVGTASAQPSRDPELAKPEVAKGVAHFEKGEFHEAYLQFKRAAATYPSAHVRAKIVLAGSQSAAMAERVDAARIGRQLLREGQMRSDDVEQVQKALEGLRPVLGHLAFKGATDRNVRVGDELVDPDALKEEWDVLPGTHVVRVGNRRETVNTPAGSVVTVELDEKVGSTVAPPPPGKTHSRWSTGKIITESVLIACGVGGLGASGAFFLVGQGQKDDAKDTSRDSIARADARSGYDTSRTLSTVFFYGGAACAVGAVLVPLLWKNQVVTEQPHQSGRLTVSPLGVFATF